MLLNERAVRRQSGLSATMPKRGVSDDEYFTVLTDFLKTDDFATELAMGPPPPPQWSEIAVWASSD